jgi:hypothetical protein
MEETWPSSRETAMTELCQMFETKLALSTGEPWFVSPHPSGVRATPHAVLDQDWELAAGATPPLGAHVVTSRIGYTHHGIYVGNGKVVHYSGLSRGWRGGPVEEVSLARFARGRPIRVRVHTDARFDRDAVVARAQSRLGENRYRALTNNCEHLCEWCIYGENRSRQVEVLRRLRRRAVRTVWRVVGTPVRLVTQFGADARRRVSVQGSEA